MSDLFARYRKLLARRDQLLGQGANPFGLRFDRLLSPTRALVEGREVLLLGTNNYLGLTFDPACVEAALAATRAYGTGTTGSRIANGTYDLHERLERALADFYDRARCLVFTTGYQANLATLAGLAGPGDRIFIDSHSHASIYDGCLLSGARIIRFRHNDAEDLERRLARHRGEEGIQLVVVEGLYSMLGDVAPLRELVAVVRRHGAWMVVDEAHSLGVYGARGRGVAEEQGVEAEVDVVVGTFSKSLGAVGGFAVSHHEGLELLRYAARPYMFTASPSPATMASVTAAIQRIRDDPSLRERIWRNARALHAGLAELGLRLGADPGPVVAVVLPDEATAVAVWNHLLAHGLYVNLALPPGTPDRRSLLRLSVSAAHSEEEIERAIAAFRELVRRFDLKSAA